MLLHYGFVPAASPDATHPLHVNVEGTPGGAALVVTLRSFQREGVMAFMSAFTRACASINGEGQQQAASGQLLSVSTQLDALRAAHWLLETEWQRLAQAAQHSAEQEALPLAVFGAKAQAQENDQLQMAAA